MCRGQQRRALPLSSLTPQIGWEQSKFIIAMTLMYLPENAQQGWLDQMNIWELGADSDPGFTNRLELHLEGKTYIARTFGRETIFGKTVQRGVAARMLEYANELVAAAYVTDPGPDLDGDGTPDWTRPRMVGGKAVVKFDPTLDAINPITGGVNTGRPGCDATDSSSCTCSSNRACLQLQKYSELPFFMRQAMRDYGLASPSMKGVY